MNYNSLINKPTINYKELIGDNTVSEVGGITEEQFTTLLNTDLSSYYTKAQIDDLFSRSYVYREKSGSIVTFDCPASVNGIDKVISEIVAVQAGSGDPSPTNVRPISGWSAVNVVVSPTTDAADGTTYTTTLKDGQGNPLTCYGGTLDVVSGVMVVEWIAVSLGNINYTKSPSGLFQTNEIASAVKKSSYSYTPTGYIKSSHFSEIDSASITGPQGSNPSPDGVMAVSGSGILYFNYWAVTDVADFKTAMASATLVYELATPITIQLTPTVVNSLEGTNNLWADSGDITVKALDKIIQG